MRYRLLGIAVCVLATLLPTSSLAQSCDEILTFHQGPEGFPPYTLWIGERILSATADPSCGGEEALGVRWWEKKVTRVATGCSPVAEAKEGPSSRPEVTFLNIPTLDSLDVVAVGEVTDTEPGLYGLDENADVYTRIRIRVTEMIRNVNRGGGIDDTISFLVPGGSVTTSRGQRFCSELAPWAHDWKLGEKVLVAGTSGAANDPTFVFLELLPLLVVGDQVSAPQGWLPNAGSVGLDQIRASAGAKP